MLAIAPRRNPNVVSAAMRRVRSRDTGPEKRLRSALWARGVRYRLGSNLPGRPDVVFPQPRVAVFVDGDFWHGRQWLTRGFGSLEEQMSRVNGGEYWTRKLRRNMERDQNNNEALQEQGWTVVRVWESEVNQDVEAAVLKVLAAIGRERA